MNEHNDHDAIARRLRETGTVPAPERLREEVMSQVRAEPRLRPSRRPFFAPMLPYAAAAAVVVGLIIAISHLGGGSSGVSGGGGSSAGGAAGSPQAVEKDAAGARGGAGDRIQVQFSIAPYEAQKLAGERMVTATKSPHAIVLAVPRSLYADYRKRLTELARRSAAGPTVRVILRRVP
jgi:hypothetical protein